MTQINYGSTDALHTRRTEVDDNDQFNERVYQVGDLILLAHPANPDSPPSRFVLPHPTTFAVGTPHDFGSSLLSPPDSAMNDHEGIKAHVRRLIAHLKSYASKVGMSVDGPEGDFIRDVRERF